MKRRIPAATGISAAAALAVALAIAPAPAFSGQDSAPSALAALASMERAFAGMTSFQADFRQTSTSLAAAVPMSQQGRIYFQRPDAMRWEYGAPEKNIYVFRAGLLLSYFPEDNQLWRQRIPPDQNQAELLNLLSGKGGIASRYIVEDNPFPEAEPGSAQIKLTPRVEGEYTYFLLEIDRRSGRLVRAIFFDWGGNRTEFAFFRLKPGARLADSVFEIKVPKDCEIVDETVPVKR